MLYSVRLISGWLIQSEINCFQLFTICILFNLILTFSRYFKQKWCRGKLNSNRKFALQYNFFLRTSLLLELKMNTLVLYIIFSFYIFGDHHYSFVNGTHVSKPLYTHLVTTFDSFTQPENFTNGTILIFSDLYQILDLDEKRGTITIKLTKVSNQCPLKIVNRIY